ncbi:MAG: hypothetical protein ACTHJM_02485 [Marmoricola sp.]
MHTRRIVATALAVAASLSLTACGSKSYTPLTQATFAKEVSLAAKDVKSVHMTMKASTLLTYDATFSFKAPVAMQLLTSTNATGTTQTAAIRVVGNAVYIQAAANGKWAKVPAAAGAAASQVKSDGPQSFVNQFKNGVKSIKYVGPTKIGGQAVQHYTLVMDASQLGTSLLALAAKVPSFANLKTYKEQVYVSNENLLRRITMTFPAPVGTNTVDFVGWNVPVTIKAPAPSDIATSGS